MHLQELVKQILAIGLISLGIIFLGFYVDRTDFWQVILGFTTAFAGYFWIIKTQQNLKVFIGLGILLRFALLFAFPLLSDDIYRFLWDGYLINNGISPFDELPDFYLATDQQIEGINHALYEKLNSPNYYTIYPPLAQATFTIATAIAGNNWWLGAFLMKFVLFASEIGTLLLLLKMLPAWKLAKSKALIYWLNPLIIIEIVGNLHFEGMMLFSLLLALYLLTRQKIVSSAVAFAAAVAAKLLPLMLLPFLIVRLWRKDNSKPFWLFSITFGISTLLLFIPLLSSSFVQNISSSLELYFRKFEFNASVYYLFRAYGFYEVGWNQIARFGPMLGKIAAIMILLLAAIEGWKAKKINASKEQLLLQIPTYWLFAFSIYLLFATTVHPWYLSIPILMSVFGRYRYPIIWSFFIVLTYASYTTIPYQENYYLVGLEYIAVIAYFIYERTKRYPLQQT